MKSFFKLSLLTVLTLGACAPQPTTGWNSSPQTTAGPAIAAPDTVTLRLAEAAEKAANSLDNISRIEGTQPVEGDAHGMGARRGEGAGERMSEGTGIAGGTSASGVTGVSSGAPVNLTAPPASMLPVGGMGGYNNASYAVAPAMGVNAQPQAQAQPAAMTAPAELTSPVTIKWYGPIEPLLGKLAARASYQFQPEGAAPPVPLTVSLDVYNQPLIEVIKSAALQVAGKADVDLDAGTQRLTLRYAPVDKGSF